MRSIVAFLVVLLFASLARGQDEEWIKLRDGDHSKEIKKGIKIAEDYFEEDAKVAKGGRSASRAASERDKALREFQQWMAETKETIGRDLREEVFIVMALLDEARVKVVDDTKGYRKGQISYFKVPEPKGMDRFEYSVIVPKKYDPEEHRYPLVISLHGRVIDAKHPAFRGEDFGERSRQVLYNYWRKSPAAEGVLVMAPTGNPGGFKFDKQPYLDLQVMYRSMIEMMTKYRVDWDRVFLELQGHAMRVACEQSFMFAGFIVRDRIEDRRDPFIPPEQFFMFENLNGTPLLYIADEENWDKVGKPISEALHAAYEKAGVPQNLIVIKDKRDANGALKGDPEVIAKFVQTHRRNNRRTSFTWRFFNDMMISPTPLAITTANFSYDLDAASTAAPLEKKAGAVKFAITKVAKAGEEPYTKINLDITEAEGVRIHLHDGIVDLNQPVTLVVNGKVIHDKVHVKRDWTIFWDRVLPGRLFMLPFVGVIDGQFPHKPQFESPEDKKEEAAAGADGAGGAGKEGESGAGDAGKGEDASGGAAASDDGGAEKK
jgi:hypothetical protein